MSRSSKVSQIWKPSAGLRNTFSTNGVNSSDALWLFVLKTVSDISLLDTDKSVKFISNALEVLATLESALMVMLSFFADVSLIWKRSRGSLGGTVDSFRVLCWISS